MTKTLYIGLGGLGGRVVSRIKKQVSEASDNEQNDLFVAFDKDVYDFEAFARDDIPYIGLCPHRIIRDQIKQYKHLLVEEWLPQLPPFLYTSTVDTGMYRAVARLAFLDVIETGRLDIVESLLDQLVIKNDINTEIQVVIVTSLAGGTGSGIFMQMALWIRTQLRDKGINGKIYGLFVGPEVFVDSFRLCPIDPLARDCLRANAYAALRELEQICKIKSGMPSALPQKMCIDGLFDSSEEQDGELIFDKIFIYDAIDIRTSGDASFDDYINSIAKFIISNFLSRATDALTSIESYINASPNCERAYNQICERVTESTYSGFNPHLDKRWIEMFYRV